MRDRSQNPYSRFREPTGYEFFDLGEKLEAEVIRVVYNEQIVPKRWQRTQSEPIDKLAGRMNDYIVDAYSNYPTTERLLEDKISAIQKAIGCVEAIDKRIQRLVIRFDHIDIDKLFNLGQMIYKESEELRKWKKSVKLIDNRRRS